MISSAIEALYIFNKQNNATILEHTYRGRPASSHTLLPLYLALPHPRPTLSYFPNINPPSALFALAHANVLFFVPTSSDTDPLFVLEFLHRVIDIFEEFLGAPLLAGKIEGNYDVVAQLLGEMCDAGSVCNTESNALREVVNTPGFIDNLLGGLGLPGSAPSLSSSTNPLQAQLAARRVASSGPAVPWRKSNVKHTSNELYVDIVETLTVTLAPSGRPLAAYANGSILFNAKISGVPELLLNLTAAGGTHTLGKLLTSPTFHPCVRLARWRERPGEFSFVPPDGKFVLASYTVDLLPTHDFKALTPRSLNLPVTLDVTNSLGATGLEFEVRLLLTPPGSTPNPARQAFSSGPRGSGRSTPSLFGSGGPSSTPSLRDVVVTIPLPETVRNITDLRASRGEASFLTQEHVVEWRIPTKEAADSGAATLRCTVAGPISSRDDDDSGLVFDAANGEYEEYTEGDAEGYQSTTKVGKADEKEEKKVAEKSREDKDKKRIEDNKVLMPRSADVSFSVKGWLASGVKVDSLTVDSRKSRGLGDGVKPVKGVKYLTVSKKGIETRC